jgi:hypothetical protein
MAEHSAFCARHMWNVLTQGPCCQCMSANEKIAYVWTEMRKMWAAGEHAPLMCPYCLTVNAVGAELCCTTLKRCVKAITERENAVDALQQKVAKN